MRKIPDATCVGNAGNWTREPRKAWEQTAQPEAPAAQLRSFNSLFIYFLSALSFAGVVFSMEMEARVLPALSAGKGWHGMDEDGE